MRFCLCLLSLLVATSVLAQDEFERPPIEYSKSTPRNAITRLQQRIERGESPLRYEDKLGYLPSLLAALNIPTESQMLVYSKTSLQRNRITPRTPRAIYFGDDVYVGYCQAGDVLELSVADPQLGAVFYTLEQKDAAAPQLVRQTDRCLQCHASSAVGDVPSHLVRSVFVDQAGMPMLSEGSHRVDHTTPIADRWGGWYVTGTHGSQTHLGNVVIRGTVPRPFKNEAGHNVISVSDRFTVEQYPSPHSDLVALMVLEHQAMVHNLIANASYTTRQALHYETEFNKALGEPADNRLGSTTSRIKSAGDKLLEALLFVDEAKIAAPLAGSSSFAQTFRERGIRDSRGRTLREFDLSQRMFKYPCSYLIDTPAFDALPAEMKSYVLKRLHNVLTGEDNSEEFAHLTPEDRTAILEILTETNPARWN